MSPAQRTLALCRRQGFTVAITEHWNQFARRRVDLFGFIDVLAISDEQTLGIQTTSGDNVSHRVEKIVTLPAAAAWLRAGNRIVVHGWSKRGPRGQRKTWACREVEITEEMMQCDSE